MSHLDPKQAPTKSELRSFAFLVGAAFVVLAALVFWRRGGGLAVFVFGILGATLVLSGFVMPGMLAPVQRTWMRLAVLLSKVTTPILMGVIFFLLFAPLGIVMRLAGRNPLRRAGRDSAWIDRAPGSRASILQRQF